MTNKVIVDTGVLTAFLDKRENYHQWTVEYFYNLPKPFITCEAVIAESCYLLSRVYKGQETLLALLESGIVTIDFTLSGELSEVKSLMTKYADVPMDLADACLVRTSEIIDNAVVFTLDSDFHVYRKHGKEQISLIIPQ